MKRFYPQSCLSINCGEYSDSEVCRSCENRPILEDFLRWRAETKATQPDPIWSRTCWESAD